MAKILMVASEAAPFVKTGGLADVLGALPKALAEQHSEVAVVLPRYRRVALREPHLVYERLRCSVGARTFEANILAEDVAGVRYFFVDIPALYDRGGIYEEAGIGYPDNHFRFAALAQAALGVARHLFPPEIVHGHDWQSGLLPVLMRDVYRNHPAYQNIKLVFTIHNLGYQGLFPAAALAEMGLPAHLFRPDLLEFHGQLNFMKGGLCFSDRITTVSPRYAAEIQTSEYGWGLDGLLRARSAVLTGILNGVDYDDWNPATDLLIPARYDHRHLEGKLECKRALLAESGLPAALEHKPLLGIVSRFADQKGLELVAAIAEDLMHEELGLVVLGSGDAPTEEFFRRYASSYPDKVAVKIGYDDGLAHRIEAGADLFLMPSRYEPCGLNQIYSLRYGTLPVVRATGGLDDTIDAETGFKFQDYSGAELLACVRDALRVYGTGRWTHMMREAMRRDFSWAASARQYGELYRRLLAS